MAHETDGLALVDGQPYILENMNTGRPTAQREIDPGKHDGGVGTEICARRPGGVVHAVCRYTGVARPCAVIWERWLSRPDAAGIYRSPACFCRSRLRWPCHRHSPGAAIEDCCIRDSLTAGFGLAANQAFPVRLTAALKAKGLNVNIVNAGVSGDTATGGLERLEWAVPQDTDAVIVELGANDMLRGINLR